LKNHLNLNSFVYINDIIMNVNFCHRVFAGSHVPFEKTLLQTVKNAKYMGMYSIQFFLGNYISIKRTQVSKADIDSTNKFITRFPTNVFTHLPYVYNLCGKGGKLYTEDVEVAKYVDSVCDSIVYEINVINGVIKNTDCQGGCVLHIGSIGKSETKKENNKMSEALDIVVNNIDKICSKLEPGTSRLLLETMVGRGGVIGTSFEQLHYIYNNLKSENKHRVGICIDTCHIHAEGLYTLDSYENIDKLFQDFNKYFDFSVLGLIHLNDSKTCHNSKVDNHERLLDGTIWKPKTLFYFVDLLEDMRVPYVLETVIDDYPLLQN
jgi:apurinic endonuclease APN1